MKLQYMALQASKDNLDSCLTPEYGEILRFLRLLSPYYPDIRDWYSSKVLPGLALGSRYVECIKLDGEIVAIGIAKRDEIETKICTIRILPEYTKQGLGSTLFKNLIEWTGNEKPHITVSEEKVPEFRRLFERYGFRLTSTNNGLYRPGKVEYLFNEPGRESIIGSRVY